MRSDSSSLPSDFWYIYDVEYRDESVVLHLFSESTGNVTELRR